LTEVPSAPEVHLDEDAVRAAARRRTMCNRIDSSSGDKADFWLPNDDPCDRERFSRRRRVAALGLELSVSAPGDTILRRLRWSAQAGGSDREATSRRSAGL
jgi:hypothetical protein